MSEDTPKQGRRSACGEAAQATVEAKLAHLSEEERERLRREFNEELDRVLKARGLKR